MPNYSYNKCSEVMDIDHSDENLLPQIFFVHLVHIAYEPKASINGRHYNSDSF